MYSVITYREPALVLAELVGRLMPDEIRGLFRDLDQRLLRAEGHLPVLLLDMSRFEAQSETLLAEIERYIERTLGAGIRIGRVMANQLMAHQMDRVVEEAGMQEQLRHFGQREPALEWLRALRVLMP